MHVLLREYKRHEGTPPWEVRRFYGPYIRELAVLGWEAMTSTTQQVDLEGPLSSDFPHHHRDVEDPH
ncbi:MAG: hypothetical protein M3O70_12470 [Actinomycetota bacterium]|nr:hypothetical protein [Actinomycetota bacterium]